VEHQHGRSKEDAKRGGGSEDNRTIRATIVGTTSACSTNSYDTVLPPVSPSPLMYGTERYHLLSSVLTGQYCLSTQQLRFAVHSTSFCR
jgi:hypothetical protein